MFRSLVDDKKGINEFIDEKTIDDESDLDAENIDDNKDNNSINY